MIDGSITINWLDLLEESVHHFRDSIPFLRQSLEERINDMALQEDSRWKIEENMRITMN